MNLEHYRNFVAIVETGTLSAASKKMCIAQPALSNQIKAFEKAYGAQLFKRGARSIELTDAGRILYHKAKNICLLEEAAYKEIGACINGSKGTLRLGLSPAYPDPFLEEIWLDFHEENPDIHYELYEVNSGEVIELLKNGMVEIGIIRTPAHIPSILNVSLSFEEKLMAVYRKKNPWLEEEMESIPISALKGIPLSIPRGFRTMIIDACMEAGFSPNLLSVSTSRVTTLMWANRGAVVAIVTAADPKEQETKNVCCKPIIGNSLSTRRSFVTLKDHQLSAVAKKFLEFCNQRQYS